MRCQIFWCDFDGHRLPSSANPNKRWLAFRRKLAKGTSASWLKLYCLPSTGTSFSSFSLSKCYNFELTIVFILKLRSRTKEITIRAVRRSKRSGSKVYVLIGSSEFLLNILPYFQANNSSSSSPAKYVLVAADSWNSNFTEGIEEIDNTRRSLF